MKIQTNMENLETPTLRPETQDRVTAFQEYEFGDLIELNRAFETITNVVRMDLRHLAEPFIDEQITPYWLGSIRRIAGINQNES